MNYSFNVYADNDFYTNIPKDNEYLQLYEQIVGIEGIYVGEKNVRLYRSRKAVLSEGFRFD